MAQPASSSNRQVWGTVAPAVCAVLLLAGCGSSGGSHGELVQQLSGRLGVDLRGPR